jgi:hypothetical protein
VAIGPDGIERLQVRGRNSLELLETSVQFLKGHKQHACLSCDVLVYILQVSQTINDVPAEFGEV